MCLCIRLWCCLSAHICGALGKGILVWRIGQGKRRVSIDKQGIGSGVLRVSSRVLAAWTLGKLVHQQSLELVWETMEESAYCGEKKESND